MAAAPALPDSLQGWLAYLETLHPQAIALGLERVHAVLGDAATVELVGILGYYVMISMTLNVFRMMPPADAELAFAER